MTALYIYLIMVIVVKKATFGVLEKVGKCQVYYVPSYWGGGGGAEAASAS